MKIFKKSQIKLYIYSYNATAIQVGN
jgi:hypothetical protein